MPALAKRAHDGSEAGTGDDGQTHSALGGRSTQASAHPHACGEENGVEDGAGQVQAQRNQQDGVEPGEDG